MEFDPALSLRHVSNTQVIFGGEDIDAKSLQSVVVNATGHRDQVLSGLSEKCTQHVLTMTIHLEAPDCACLSCLGRDTEGGSNMVGKISRTPFGFSISDPNIRRA